MKTITEDDQNLPIKLNSPKPMLDTFSTTLRDGTEITIREMTGKDLVIIEEEFDSMADMRKNFHIMELLAVSEPKITYDYLESLGVQDIKRISELIAKANGDPEEEENEGAFKGKKRR